MHFGYNKTWTCVISFVHRNKPGNVENLVSSY